MSYTGLVADANHAQTSGEKFLDQVVLFVVERGAAKMRDGLVLHQRLAVLLFHEVALACVPKTIGDHVHGFLERNLFPLGSEWSAILDGHQALGMSVEFLRVGTLGAEASTRDR